MTAFGSTFEWAVTMADGRKMTGKESITSPVLTIVADLPEGEVSSIRGRLSLSLPEDVLIFMNGYQSWTDCREYKKTDKIRGLAAAPPLGIRSFALDRYADYHFQPYPNCPGVLQGYSYGHFRYPDGRVALFGSRNEDLGYTVFTYRNMPDRMLIFRDSYGLSAGGKTPIFDLFFMEGEEDAVYDAWFASMGKKALPAKPMAGYSSWYNRYQKIDEASMWEDLVGTEGLLKEGDLFQIDDGWETFIGDWLTPDPVKFSKGMSFAARRIHEAGYKAGLWLAPFVAETKSALYKEHPDWFLLVPDAGHVPATYTTYVLPPFEKRSGEPWKCGSNWSGFYALDIDNPEVLSYLEEVFRTVREFGFDLVKLDFLYAAAPFGSAKESRAARMDRAMRYLREWCGDMEILGCGVPLFPAFGKVEYCRVSCDVSLEYNDKIFMWIIHRERPSTKHAIRTDRARHPLDGRAFGNDPDVFFLRTENIRLTAQQKAELIRTCVESGSVFLTSDNMSTYTDRQAEQYTAVRVAFEDACAEKARKRKK